jgi:hypothetical protein
MFIASVSQPGFLPLSEPDCFDTPQEAWESLADQRRQFEDDVREQFTNAYGIIADTRFACLEDGYSSDVNLMEQLSRGENPYGWPNLTGSVNAPSMSDVNHDLGYVYEVMEVPPC